MASKYTAAHKSPAGAGDSRPTALQIVKDEGRNGQLGDKVMLITGCSSGLGIETARALFATGATLFVTGRDPERVKSALPDIFESDRVHFLRLDLNTLDSVRSCASEFLMMSRTLNVLINNAGVMHTPEGRTMDGFETQFGTNHLAHFLLFNLLTPTLLSSSMSDFASRVVNLSSSGHRIAGIQFDDLNFEKQPYNGWLAYGQSKTANIYMANEIERRYGEKRLHAISVHPGSILSGLQKTVPDEMRQQWKHESVQKVMKSPAQGAATTVFAAISKELEGKGGIYLENCTVASQVKDGAQMRDPGYAVHAFDQEKEGRLWTESLKMQN
ncbi:hypothetical protein ANO11243_007110 [Dothideomycetidae sp. 11243]|nr:hypothetical protein ANO11243_007110 [fungal sp. No.11243]